MGLLRHASLDPDEVQTNQYLAAVTLMLSIEVCQRRSFNSVHFKADRNLRFGFFFFTQILAAGKSWREIHRQGLRSVAARWGAAPLQVGSPGSESSFDPAPTPVMAPPASLQFPLDLLAICDVIGE
jgi:hypothetical protein